MSRSIRPLAWPLAVLLIAFAVYWLSSEREERQESGRSPTVLSGRGQLEASPEDVLLIRVEWNREDESPGFLTVQDEKGKPVWILANGGAALEELDLEGQVQRVLRVGRRAREATLLDRTRQVVRRIPLDPESEDVQVLRPD